MLVRASLRAGTSFHGIFNGKFARLAAVFTARESNFPKFHKKFLWFVQCSKQAIVCSYNKLHNI